MMRLPALFLFVLALLLNACGQQEPLKIGFIGGLSDRNSDNGQSGLNGVMLAVEQFNRNGGIGGRLVELVARDDAQRRETAENSAKDLVAAGVEAVIGPFTSSMAEVIVPITGQAGIFQISPTVTSMAFYGKDDNLFRINRTTRDNAQEYAKVMTGLGQRNIAVAYDTRNRNFTESWLNEFRTAIAAEHATIAVAVPYESATDTDFAQVIGQMLAANPDSLFFISGALDVARFAQAARTQAPSLPIGAAEWAATEQLIDLGGEFVEGMLIVQNFDRDDQSPRYRDFAEAYFKRFQRPPGYSSVSAHDAATVVLTALKQRKRGETLKDAARRAGPYQGLQQEIVFDKNGDTRRRVYFRVIRQGSYAKPELLEKPATP